MLKSIVKTIKTTNVVIMGDFNSYRRDDYSEEDLDKLKKIKKYHGWPDIFETPKKIRSLGYVDSFVKFFKTTKQKGNFPKNTSKYGGRVDFIFVNKEISFPILGCYVMFTELSDHLPNICDLFIG